VLLSLSLARYIIRAPLAATHVVAVVVIVVVMEAGRMPSGRFIGTTDHTSTPGGGATIGGDDVKCHANRRRQRGRT
jgi:hypothetical protein